LTDQQKRPQATFIAKQLGTLTETTFREGVDVSCGKRGTKRGSLVRFFFGQESGT
jgi:hypothetical protein